MEHKERPVYIATQDRLCRLPDCRRVVAPHRVDYIAGIQAGRYMETDGDIMGKKRKDNRLEGKRERERGRHGKEMKQKREAIKIES